MDKVYIAIDLKSFYASVECVERGLDPLNVNLVVADESRTEKTICLAVSPTLKAYGIPGRARLFEVVQEVERINALRLAHAPGRRFYGVSYVDSELKADKSLSLDYITAKPRMALYMRYSTDIYKIYLKYVAPEDIHVYSVDEVFIDATAYLGARGQTPREFAQMLVLDVLRSTGITATAGIGSNLYLCKIAMDILAKKTAPDEHGVRIAELNERSYRERLWNHRPLTDFWRVGGGTARKLEENGIHTMGDVALYSLYNEERLYKLFGINAELLIDHAWGWESCTIAQIKSYRPESSSLSSGQVLSRPYSFEEGRLIIHEMTDLLALDLVSKGLLTDQVVLTVGYDRECLRSESIRAVYSGGVSTDHYGRAVPAHAHGSANLGCYSSSSTALIDAVLDLYDRVVSRELLVRRMCVAANHVLSEAEGERLNDTPQLSLFEDSGAQAQRLLQARRERSRQQAIIKIQQRYGKNALLKGMNFLDGATARARNAQIGGHSA